MKDVVVTVPEDLEEALVAYQRRRGVDLDLSSAVQAALRDYLIAGGNVVSPPTQPLRMTPAVSGSGLTDVSVNHDRHFAAAVLERKAGDPR